MLSVAESDAICFTLYSVATCTTILRLYTRGFVLRAVGLDDVLIAIASLLGAAFCAAHHEKLVGVDTTYQLTLAAGGKLVRSPAFVAAMRVAVRAAFGAGMAYLLMLMCIKLSILAFFRRLAVDKRHHYVLYFTGACIIAYTLANCLASIFQVDPPQANWNFGIKGARARFQPEHLQTSNSAFQATVDLVILLLPIPILLKLQSNRRTKVALAFIFSLGIFSLATTIIRLTKSIQFQKAKGLRSLELQPVLTYWTDIEVNTAIMVANLPALSALVRGKRSPISPRPSGYEKGRYGGSSGTAESNSQASFARKGAVSSTASGGRTFLVDEDEEKAPVMDLPAAPPTSRSSRGITRVTEFRLDVEGGDGAPRATGPRR